MNYLYPSFAGLCLVLSACSAANDQAQARLSGTAGSAGSTDSVGAGGDPGNGDPTAQGGNTSATGGANADAGSSASAGSSAGGLSGTGGAGGMTAMGGSATGGSATGGAGGAPAIDYSIWVLQLPIGSGTSPTTISSKQLLGGFSNAYFYTGDGGQAFMDPATGVTTSGSQHCRTEMRESTVGGGQAAWSATGTNIMTVSGKVSKVGGGTAGTVTLGQVFNGTDSIPLCEFEYSASAKGFKLLYEEAKGAGTVSTLNVPVPLNTRYTFTLALTKGVLTVHVNGTQVYAHTPSTATLAKKFYFKFGNYDQTTSAGPSSTTPYTVVYAYDVSVVHQ